MPVLVLGLETRLGSDDTECRVSVAAELAELRLPGPSVLGGLDEVVVWLP